MKPNPGPINEPALPTRTEFELLDQWGAYDVLDYGWKQYFTLRYERLLQSPHVSRRGTVTSG